MLYVVDGHDAHQHEIAQITEHLPYELRAFDSGEAFLEGLEPDAPGCALLELRLPGMGGLDVQAALLERELSVSILLVTGHADVAVAVSAIKRGAVDVLERPFRPQRLLDAVYEAMVRGWELHESHACRRGLRERFGRLTQGELEVVAALTRGHTNKMIAAQLSVTPQAVDSRRANAMGKLEVTSLAALVRDVACLRSHGLHVDEFPDLADEGCSPGRRGVSKAAGDPVPEHRVLESRHPGHSAERPEVDTGLAERPRPRLGGRPPGRS